MTESTATGNQLTVKAGPFVLLNFTEIEHKWVLDQSLGRWVFKFGLGGRPVPEEQRKSKVQPVSLSQPSNVPPPPPKMPPPLLMEPTQQPPVPVVPMQQVQGEIDHVGKGVIIDTIQLAEVARGEYDGEHDLWNSETKRGVPPEVVKNAWRKAVEDGARRWDNNMHTKREYFEKYPKVLQQNHILNGIVELGREVLYPHFSAQDSLRYVLHRHISSQDGLKVMIYGREFLGWKNKDVAFDAVEHQGDEGFLAMLGISNASFVEHLIKQFGNDLGIKRLKSISVEGGWNVRWTFE